MATSKHLNTGNHFNYKFSAKIEEKLREYVDRCKHKVEPFPSFVSLSLHLGVNRQTLNNWKTTKSVLKSCPDYPDLIESVKKFSETDMREKGLNQKYSAAMSIFLLKNNHGYKDKQDIEHSGEVTEKILDLANLSKEQIKAFLNKEE